jgi:hypothetical protein
VKKILSQNKTQYHFNHGRPAVRLPRCCGSANRKDEIKCTTKLQKDGIECMNKD